MYNNVIIEVSRNYPTLKKYAIHVVINEKKRSKLSVIVSFSYGNKKKINRRRRAEDG